MPSVLQDWVQGLSFMQQSVLLAAIRGPDGLHKEHVAKYVLRWLRRCILISAFDKKVLESPTESGGGSFTGPMRPASDRTYDSAVLESVFAEYLRCVDEVPHHFHMHLVHAVEILGYKHPKEHIRVPWHTFYLLLCQDAHLYPEPILSMDQRLGDNEQQWRDREAVPARDQPLKR